MSGKHCRIYERLICDGEEATSEVYTNFSSMFPKKKLREWIKNDQSGERRRRDFNHLSPRPKE